MRKPSLARHYGKYSLFMLICVLLGDCTVARIQRFHSDVVPTSALWLHFSFPVCRLKSKGNLLTIEAYNLKGDVSKVDIDKKTNTTSNLMINMGRDNQEQ